MHLHPLNTVELSGAGSATRTTSRRSLQALLALFGASLGLVACGGPAFPQELFTVSAPNADYPVMLSEVPKTAKPKKGRALHSESGTSTSVSSSSYTTGNTTVTVTTTSSARSEMTASEKLGAQVQRKDRWICLDRASFSAKDFSTYGAASAARLLSIDGSAYR